MKMLSKISLILTGTFLLIDGNANANPNAIVGVVCPPVNTITAQCDRTFVCQYHTTGGTPNDFTPYQLGATGCTSDFDCTIVASKPSISLPTSDNNDVYCSYAIQSQTVLKNILYSSHFPLYDYTPSDAPECKGATPSDKPGYCVTAGNTAKSKI